MDSIMVFTKKVPEDAASGIFCQSFLNVRLCCLLLFLSAVEPFADVVINGICDHTCSNGDKKGFKYFHYSFTTFPPKAWGVGNINIIAYFVIFCQEIWVDKTDFVRYNIFGNKK